MYTILKRTANTQYTQLFTLDLLNPGSTKFPSSAKPPY